jgi:hypothetical protein
MAKKQNTVKGIISGKVDANEWMKSNGGYPEVGSFADNKSIQKFYRQLTQEQLDSWCELEGLEYKGCPEQPPIHRMRACMAILYRHFPKEVAPKKESPYKKYSTEELVQLALDNNVAFEMCDDERILRMRAIMALRANKVIEEQGA